MFCGSSELLERHLHTDMNALIKNVKLRGDVYLSILQYNKALIAQHKQLDTIAFLNEELIKHKTFFNSISETHKNMDRQDHQLMEKYLYTSSSQTQIIKLMGRVVARILETIEASIDKAKYLDETIIQKQSQFKSVMMKILNDKPKLDIQLVIETIVTYVQAKIIDQLNRLKKIIEILEQGDMFQLDSIYQLRKIPTKTINFSVQKKESKAEKIKNREKLQKIKEQMKKIQRMKKKKMNMANRMLVELYNTMDLSRKQFFQDMIFNNAQQKTQRLYDEMLCKNKHNHGQILNFEAKKSQYQKKLQQFKKRMQYESKKIAEALQMKQFQGRERKKQFLTINITNFDKDISDDEESLENDKSKLVLRIKDKKAQKNSSPKLVKQSKLGSILATQEGFHLLKFDMKNQEFFTSNKGKLPSINTRSTIEDRYGNSRSCPKEQKKMTIAKNILFGVVGTNSKKVSEIDKKLSNNKIKKEGFGALNVVQYSFYGQKNGKKWYDTKTKLTS